MKHRKMTGWLFIAVLLLGVLVASAKRLLMDLRCDVLKILKSIIEVKFAEHKMSYFKGSHQQ